MHTLRTCVTEPNVMVLPGRVLGYKLLPSSTTKHQVWELYQQTVSVESIRPVSYATFMSLWLRFFHMWSSWNPWVTYAGCARKTALPSQGVPTDLKKRRHWLVKANNTCTVIPSVVPRVCLEDIEITLFCTKYANTVVPNTGYDSTCNVHKSVEV